MREVYINKQRVDVEDDNVVALIFNSPIFKDLNSIQSNGTTTYALPKTTHNLAVIENSNQPDVQTTFPYKEYHFEEWRNGLPIIQNGRCRLLSINEKIELAVAWGNKANFTEQMKLKLTDPLFDNETAILWNENSEYLQIRDIEDSIYSTPGFVYIDFGQGTDNMKYVHPGVNLEYIFNRVIAPALKIKFDYGQSPDTNYYPQSDLSAIFQKTWIPLLSKNANEDSWKSSASTFYFDGYSSSLFGFYDAKLSVKENTQGYVANNQVIKKNEGKRKFNVDLTSFGIKNFDGNPIHIIAHPIGKPSQTYFLKTLSNFTKGNNDVWYPVPDIMQKPDVDIHDDLENFNISILTGHFYPNNITTLDMDKIEGKIEMKYWVETEEVLFPSFFPVCPNLPDMSCLDFIKSVMHMYGLFAYYDAKIEGVIKLISIDDIYKLIPNAPDWTNKTISEIKKITHTFGDYARYNKLQYAEDDSVYYREDINDYIVVNNEGLEKNKDLVTLKFSPSENRGNFAYIPLYTQKDGNVEYSSLKDRILRIKEHKIEDENENITRFARGYFDDDIKFIGENGMLLTYYKTYQEIIRNPVVVEVDVYLNETELHNFSEIQPIYLKGSYYMPIKVTADAQGKTQCQLLLIPKPYSI